MRKVLIAATIALTFLGYAFANEQQAWFNGGVAAGFPNDETMTGGAWSNVTDQTAWDDTKKAVVVTADDATPLTFVATEAMTIGDDAKSVTITSEVTLTPFDELPAAPDAKAGAIVYDGYFYVFAKDENANTNTWVKTKVEASSVAQTVSVTLAKTDGGYEATYTLGEVQLNPLAVVITDEAKISTANYEGDCEIASLCATVEMKPVNPQAKIEELAEKPKNLDAAYNCLPTTDKDAFFNGWEANITVSFDKAVTAGTVVLSGQYNMYDWTPYPITEDLAANEEITLLPAGLVHYQDLYKMLGGFNCGVKNLSQANEGTGMTVKIVLTSGEKTIVMGEQGYTLAFNPPTVVVEQMSPIPEALDDAYTFAVPEDEVDKGSESPFKDWKADFYVSFDKDIAADSVLLSGSYAAYQSGEWISFKLPALVKDEEVALVQQMVKWDGLTYEMLCDVVKAFNCGVKNISGPVGATMTVRLVMKKGEETIVLNTQTYTFEAKGPSWIDPSDEENTALYNVWATIYGVTDPTAAKQDAFLLNCDNTDEAIEEAKKEFTLTITFDDEGNPVVECPNEEGYNGTVILMGKAALTDEDWHAKAKGDQFFKAKLQLIPANLGASPFIDK